MHAKVAKCGVDSPDKIIMFKVKRKRERIAS